MYRSFNDFRQLIPFTSDFLVGFRPLGGEFKVNYYDLILNVTNTLSNSATSIARSITGTQIALAFDTYTSVSQNSAFWNTAYNFSTVYSTNSATYTTYNYVYGNFLPLTGGTLTGGLTATQFNTSGMIISAGRDLSSLFGDSTSTSLTTVLQYLSTNLITISALDIADYVKGPFLSAGNGITFVIV